MNGRLLYYQPEMARLITDLADKATSTCVGEYVLLSYFIKIERKYKSMNKVELIGAVASKSEISKKDVEKVINAFTNVVADALVDGDKVQLVGFGTFEVVERAERQGRNPATGEAMTIAASKSPKFKAGKALKDAVKA